MTLVVGESAEQGARIQPALAGKAIWLVGDVVNPNVVAISYARDRRYDRSLSVLHPRFRPSCADYSTELQHCDGGRTEVSNPSSSSEDLLDVHVHVSFDTWLKLGALQFPSSTLRAQHTIFRKPALLDEHTDVSVKQV